MTIPKIARIHLVYQFIILTLIVFAIGYNEILPDKKYLFIALIPVFCYQIMIVFCCTELLPVPSWMNFQENVIMDEDRDTVIETKAPASDEGLDSVQKLVESPEPTFPKKLSSLKQAFKNRKFEIPECNNLFQYKEVDVCGTEGLNNTKTPERNALQDKLKTKSYYFPYRQKWLEEWIEQKESARPYKVRNSKSGDRDKHLKSPSNQKNPSVQTGHVEEQKSSIPVEYVNENQIDENDTTGIKKSYSFPFRQKRLEIVLERDEISENDLIIPTMPQWKHLKYNKSGNPYDGKRKFISTEALQEELKRIESYDGKRKFISTEALQEELKRIESSCQEKQKNDFSQSMELTGTLCLDACAIRKIPLKPSTSFNKFKQGVVNYFNKIKRESFKTVETKQNAENRKKFFRELFSSKESLNFESVAKEESAKQIISMRSENRSNLGEMFQPSYVSYASDSFSDDVNVYSYPKKF